MTARTFGRRGLSYAGESAGAISARRAALLGGEPRQPVQATDDGAARRAAFLAEERARSGPAAATLPMPSDEAVRAVMTGEAAEFTPTDRSLRTAYLLWFCLGLAGGHRFYLRRPLTGALQAALFLGCWGATLLEYYQAFAGLGLSCLWMVADGFLVRRMHERSGRG